MDEKRREQEALFRHSVLGGLCARRLKRGELRRGLRDLAGRSWTGPDGRERRMAVKTLEEWYYRYLRDGFVGLLPQARSDLGCTKALSPEVQALVLAMKREDPGRSAPLVLHELVQAGRLRRGQVSVSTIQRLLAREGLSGPHLELDRPARYRWQASFSGELWQSDALHGPKLFHPAAGCAQRVKVFALLDDKSRLVAHIGAGFREQQADFLRVLAGAIMRRGLPRHLLVDNHKSFAGGDTRLACAKLNIHLTHARPYDGPAKGKIERFWRTLRQGMLDRLDLEQVTTLDDLNLRLATWVQTHYNVQPHASLSGRTPLEAWDQDAEQIRWLDDPTVLEEAFSAHIERRVLGDSTCQIRGRAYEVPTHLRGRIVKIGYSLLSPTELWVQDGATRVMIREVNATDNMRRPRRATAPIPHGPAPATGLNAVEDLIRRIAGGVRKDDGDAA